MTAPTNEELAAFAAELRKWWSFDDHQFHTHTWHTREDFIKDELPKLLAAQRLEVRESEARDRIAKAIWAKRPDCAGKPWPLADDYSKRAYKHNPIAAVDLCFAYADAAIAALAAQRLEVREISEAQRTAAIKASCDVYMGEVGEGCKWPECHCGGWPLVIDAALTAALECNDG